MNYSDISNLSDKELSNLNTNKFQNNSQKFKLIGELTQDELSKLTEEEIQLYIKAEEYNMQNIKPSYFNSAELQIILEKCRRIDTQFFKHTAIALKTNKDNKSAEQIIIKCDNILYEISKKSLLQIKTLSDCLLSTPDDTDLIEIPKKYDNKIFQAMLDYAKLYENGCKYPCSIISNHTKNHDMLDNTILESQHDKYYSKLSNYHLKKIKYEYCEYHPPLDFYMKRMNDLSEQEESIINEMLIDCQDSFIKRARSFIMALNLADFMQFNAFKGFIHMAIFKETTNAKYSYLFTLSRPLMRLRMPTTLYMACYESYNNTNMYYDINRGEFLKKYTRTIGNTRHDVNPI